MAARRTLFIINAGQSVIRPGGETFHSSSQYPQIIVDNRVDGRDNRVDGDVDSDVDQVSVHVIGYRPIQLDSRSDEPL